jgi:hypothetical protein
MPSLEDLIKAVGKMYEEQAEKFEIKSLAFSWP